MNYLIIAGAAFAVSLLTLFSGFGLGTLLMPVFALFFPLPLAIGLTAVVHLLNNLFKLSLLGRHASRGILIRFGIPSMLGAVFGAWCLVAFADQTPLLVYSFFGKEAEISTVKLTISAVMAVFALFEILPWFRNVSFAPRYLPLGGVVSGFFGGLSGHQGALRSAFLVRSGLSKEAFLGTGVVIAVLTDLVRLSFYTSHFSASLERTHLPYLAAAAIPAFAGALLGNRFLKKITLDWIQKIVTFMLFGIALGLGMGWI